MEFFKKLRATGQSSALDQTKPSQAALADSLNNLIVQNIHDDLVQNAVAIVSTMPGIKSRDLSPTCQASVQPVHYDRHHSGHAAVLKSSVMRGPIVLPSWEEFEELEAKLEETEVKFEKERKELRKKNEALSRKFEAAEQSKKALVNNLLELKENLTRSEHIISALKTSEAKAMELHGKQQDLINSLLAVREKAKTTKFITGNHRVSYGGTTGPSAMVREEMSLAAERQRQEIARLASVVDTLAVQYSGDRYSNISTVITNPPADAEPQTCVPDEFLGLWLFTVEPTQEELEMYEKVLEEQIRPPPIYSPSLPKPRIQWTRLNTNMFRNLPQPEQLPIFSCSQDPQFYSAIKSISYGGTVNVFEGGIPFGTMYGFMTDMGAVPVPEESIHGYKFSPEWGTWVIAARGV